MVSDCEAGIHLDVDPDVAAKSSEELKRRTRPVNDEIYTRELVGMIEGRKTEEGRTYHPSGNLQVAPHTRPLLLARWKAQILFETAERYENGGQEVVVIRRC